MKHYIISRVALKWRFAELGMSWEEWLKNSIELYDKYCRASLRNQTNQNFTLVSVVDESVNDIGVLLPNEIIVKIQKKETFKQALNRALPKEEKLLITRIDRDDCLNKNFVEKLNLYVKNECKKQQYIDTENVFRLNIQTNELFLGVKYKTMVSPFVSSFENLNSVGLIKCYPYSIAHNKLPEILKGIKISTLSALQIVHENNILNKNEGVKLHVNIDEFLKDYL